MTERKTFEVGIVRPIDSEERNKKLNQLYVLDQRKDKVAEKLGAVKKKFKKRADEIEDDRQTLMKSCKRGFERVDVRVYTKVDEETHTVMSYDADTDEHLPQLDRALTIDERQTDLDFGESQFEPGEDAGLEKLNAPLEDEDEEDDEDTDLDDDNEPEDGETEEE